MPTVKTPTSGFLALLVFGLVAFQPIDVTALDVSNFTKFTFSQESAFGFCPSIDTVFRAGISVEDETYTLKLSLLEDGAYSSSGDCLTPLGETGLCAREITLVDRELTAEEIATVRTAFSDIAVETPLPGCGAIDPCRINVFTWDGDRLSDSPCAERRVSYKQSQALVDLLEHLRREVRDFSDFTRFDYSQDPAFGFCPNVGEVFSAKIDASRDGYVLNMSRLEEGSDVEEECFDGPRAEGRRCLVVRPLPERLLTADEVTHISTAFSDITVNNHQDPGCPLIDPCRIRNFTWDDTAVTDSPCGIRRVSWEQADLLVAALERLSFVPPAPPAFLRGDCDGDGRVGGNVSDAMILLGFVYKNRQAPTCLAACDAEANGSLNVTDALRILRFSFADGPPPDSPFPECTESNRRTDLEIGCAIPPDHCQ